MWQFIDDHFEGIVALVLGAMIPLVVWGMRQYQNNILEQAENQLNQATKRFDLEIGLLRETLIVLKEAVNHLMDKQLYLHGNADKQLRQLEIDIKQIEELKNDLQSTREIMLLQHTAIKQQIEDFREFCKELLFSK